MIRELIEDDIKAITDICRKGMQYDSFTEELVREKTIDAVDYQPELGLVYEQGAKVLGFAQFVFGKRGGKPHGWLRLLVVNPSYWRQGIGSVLLAEGEKRLAQLGALKITTMDAVPNYLTPGIDFRYTEAFCFLTKHGYEKIRDNINLICEVSLMKFDVSAEVAKLRQEGFEIRRAEPQDLEAVLSFIRQEFPSWEGEVLETFRNEPISLYICIHQQKVVGFSAYDSNNKNTGWFGPMGVLPVTRGKGIGAVVCKLCLRDIALQGHRYSIIPWVGPVGFYARVCQARIDRLFWVWQKNLQ